MRNAYFCLLITLMSFSAKKTYTTIYYNSGKAKAKGWIENKKKTDYWTFFYENGSIASKGNFNKGAKEGYWFFYDKNGNKKKEGHYVNNYPTQWWIYYYDNTYENCLYQPDGKTRFCLTYENGSITKAKKYANDVFLQQWSDIFSFKHDNPDFKF